MCCSYTKEGKNGCLPAGHSVLGVRNGWFHHPIMGQMQRTNFRTITGTVILCPSMCFPTLYVVFYPYRQPLCCISTQCVLLLSGELNRQQFFSLQVVTTCFDSVRWYTLLFVLLLLANQFSVFILFSGTERKKNKLSFIPTDITKKKLSLNKMLCLVAPSPILKACLACF